MSQDPAATLVPELKRLVVEAANLQQLDPERLDETAAIYGEGLGLDSIDILELVVHVERRWGLKIRNDDEGRKALRNLRSLAETIAAHKSC